MIKNIFRAIATKVVALLSLFGYPNIRESGTPFDHIMTMYLDKNDPKDFFFIQIGAHNGIANDPIRKHILKYRLRGILLEPQKYIFRSLVENYRDQPQLIFENVAVSNRDETKALYYIKNESRSLPPWADQLASFSRETILSHGDAIYDIALLIAVENVECVSLHTLLDRHKVAHIDLMQIDAEGYDYEIIKTIDFSKVKPHIIHFEHKHLNAMDTGSCVKLLMNQGYQISFFDNDAIAYTPILTI